MDQHASNERPSSPGGPQAGATIRVAIIDDHQLMNEALALVLNREPGLSLVGSAATCAGAQSLVANTRPDVLLLDVGLPDGDGLALIPTIRAVCPAVQILVLTSFADQTTLLRAVQAGVSGFIGKQQPVADVLAAIRQVVQGEVVMPARLLIELLSRRKPAPPGVGPLPEPATEPLTPRELEVLACAAEGASSEQIAQQLTLSVLTVRTHLRNILRKLNAHSRLEAVAIAMRQGLITPGRESRTPPPATPSGPRLSQPDTP